VLRFVVVTAVGLLVAGAGIVAIVNHAFAREAQRQANEHAQQAVTAAAAGALERTDFRRGLPAARRAELRRELGAALGDGTGAALYGRDGRLALAVPAAGLTPAPPRGALVASALDGNVASRVASTPGGRVVSTYVPVRGARGGTVGVVQIDRDYDPIAAAALRSSLVVAGVLELLLLVLCALLVPVLSRSAARLRRHVDELDHVATHDDLTGLPNRLGFQRELDVRMREEEHEGALLVFDLAEFHEINNALGASGGDALLVEVAERLQANADGATLGRLGEDEFGILLDTRDQDALAERARDLRDAFARPMSVKGVRLAVDPWFGAALIPDHGPDLDQVLRRASIALGAAKDDQVTLRVFDPADDVADRSRLELVAELREALRDNQLVVHYQPQADLTTHAVRGIEALVRWEHPTHGTLLPDFFIPLAERTGLITQIDRFVLRQAMKDWETLQAHGVVIDMAVNLSPLDLLDAEFAGQIGDLLHAHRLPPEHLVLEITERILVRDDRRTHNGLHRLAATGARLSIDDFGTGYSSLAYLYKLPIRQVKLDRTFIANVPQDPSSDAIVRATVELAHTLNATVVAEGVETQSQWEHLETLRCDIAQGYFIGKPQPAADVIELLTRHPGEPVLVAA
jgi:diguanylate cyclase (GGDEF)-like protein